MSDNFKELLNSFIKEFIIKINDTSIINDIQNKYEELIDSLEKLTILTKEDFESIDNDLRASEEQNKKYSEEITKLENELSQSKTQSENDIASLNKKYEVEVKNLNQKYENDIKAINQQMESEKIKYTDKINLMSNTLNSYEELQKKYNSLESNYNSLGNKYEALNQENIENKIKIQDLTKNLSTVQAENKKLSGEIFQKFEKINNLEKEIKLKSINLENTEIKRKDLVNANTKLYNENKEMKSEISKIKILSEVENNKLKKQIETLVKSNTTLIEENSIAQNKIKDFQTYTNFAKVNTAKLDKKDFSVLEGMSNRINQLEFQYNNLNEQYLNLQKENKNYKKKLDPLEKLILLYMKEDKLNDNNFDEKMKAGLITKEDIKEIEELKNNPDKLFYFCINLKNDNLLKQKEIEEITIECNQRLREAAKK